VRVELCQKGGIVGALVGEDEVCPKLARANQRVSALGSARPVEAGWMRAMGQTDPCAANYLLLRRCGVMLVSAVSTISERRFGELASGHHHVSSVPLFGCGARRLAIPTTDEAHNFKEGTDRARAFFVEPSASFVHSSLHKGRRYGSCVFHQIQIDAELPGFCLGNCRLEFSARRKCPTAAARAAGGTVFVGLHDHGGVGPSTKGIGKSIAKVCLPSGVEVPETPHARLGFTFRQRFREAGGAVLPLQTATSGLVDLITTPPLPTVYPWPEPLNDSCGARAI